MSAENVEVVRAAMEAYQRPEMLASLVTGELDLALADPQIEWDASRLGEMIPDLAEVYFGHEPVSSWRTFPDQESALEAVGLRE